jgi:ketosteroid isomerase-like protein
VRLAAVILAAGLAACRIAPAALTDEHARAIVDSVRTTFGDYVARLNARDLDSVARFYADAPGFQWVEDGDVRYASRSDIQDALRRLAVYRDIRFSADEPRVVALAPGAAALAVTFDQALVDSGGEGSGTAGAMSLAAVHRPGGWKWLTVHTSLRREPVTPPARR